jgi:hypothetical protein
MNSLDERRQKVWRQRDNHASVLAPGVVVMAVTAFDAWLNEIIGFCRHLSEDRIAELIEMRVLDKYREIGKLPGRPFSVPRGVRVLIEVRNEIVHFLPYSQDITSGNTIPQELRELEKEGLFITTGDPTAEFHFSQRLCSYALGYWACQTVHAAAQALADTGVAHDLVSNMVGNFAFYSDVFPPANLASYDQRFNLGLARDR